MAQNSAATSGRLNGIHSVEDDSPPGDGEEEAGPSGSGEAAGPSTSTGGSTKQGKSSGSGKTKPPGRKGSILEGKPKHPKSGYIFFMQDAQNEFKAHNVEKSQGFKVISERWAAMDPEQRKKYEEMADQDKKRYREEMIDFEAEHGKVPKGVKRKVKKKMKVKIKEENAGRDSDKKSAGFKLAIAGNATLTVQTGSGHAKKVPVFSGEFLEHNKVMEAQLRAVRSASKTMEQECANLECQIEKLTVDAEKLDAEARQKAVEQEACEAYSEAVKQLIIKNFSSLSVPGPDGSQMKPNHENIDVYCKQLAKQFAHGTCPSTMLSYRELFRRTNWPS